MGRKDDVYCGGNSISETQILRYSETEDSIML